MDVKSKPPGRSLWTTRGLFVPDRRASLAHQDLHGTLRDRPGKRTHQSNSLRDSRNNSSGLLLSACDAAEPSCYLLAASAALWSFSGGPRRALNTCSMGITSSQ